MTEETRTEIQQWVIKAQHDLGSARRLLEGDEPYLDTAVYHCQQAVEKGLKAFLTYSVISFEKTHDLTELVALAIQAEPSLNDWREVAQELTPYAVRFRYPADVLEPDREEADQAVQHAQVFLEAILQLLPGETKP